MKELTSFKLRVRNAATQYAIVYNTVYVCQSYLLLSDAFQKKPFYVIEAEASNYLHLLGVSTCLSPNHFYNKCLDNTLSESDFEISFRNLDSKASKGVIRNKILALQNMFSLFQSSCLVEEDFNKNVIRCSFASTNSLCTLGFIATPKARPMTLLRGDELDHHKAKPLTVVLSKKRNELLYSNLVFGNIASVKKAETIIYPLLSDTLKYKISASHQ